MSDERYKPKTGFYIYTYIQTESSVVCIMGDEREKKSRKSEKGEVFSL